MCDIWCKPCHPIVHLLIAKKGTSLLRCEAQGLSCQFLSEPTDFRWTQAPNSFCFIWGFPSMGIPQMIVYSGKSCLKNWWLGVTPIYGNHHMVYCCRTWHQVNLTSHALIQFIWIHLMVTVYNPTSLHIKLVWSLPSGRLSWSCSKMAHIYGWFNHEIHGDIL
jgi:hypothetical protein